MTMTNEEARSLYVKVLKLQQENADRVNIELGLESLRRHLDYLEERNSKYISDLIERDLEIKRLQTMLDASNEHGYASPLLEHRAYKKSGHFAGRIGYLMESDSGITPFKIIFSDGSSVGVNPSDVMIVAGTTELKGGARI